MISSRKLNSSIQNFQFSLWTSNDNDGNHMIKLVHMMQRIMIMMDIIWIWSADSVYYSKMISWMWSKPKAHIAHHYDIFLCSLDVVIVQSQAIHDDDDDGDYEDDDDYEGSPDRGHRRSAPPRTLDPYSPVGTTPPPFAAPGSFSFAASILKYVLQNKERSVQDLSQLLPVFVKVVKVTWVCQSCYMHLPSCYMYFSPNQTQMKFDKDFEARWNFCFFWTEITRVAGSATSIRPLRSA